MALRCSYGGEFGLSAVLGCLWVVCPTNPPQLPLCMAEVVAILTTCWKLVRAIEEVMARIKQTRDDARVLTVSLRETVQVY